jgi:hypothetical protein
MVGAVTRRYEITGVGTDLARITPSRTSSMQDPVCGLPRIHIPKLSEKPHERAKRLSIRRLMAT